MEFRNVLILGGTSDTHKFVKNNSLSNYFISVATEYGYESFKKLYGDKVVYRPFDENSLKEFVLNKKIETIVDTTHPFAKKISALAKDLSKKLGIEYLNLSKREGLTVDYEKVAYFYEINELVTFLKEKRFRKIFFTIGSKLISCFSEFADFGYVRILPFEDSIKKVRNAGFEYSRIIAMQGPFSVRLNVAMIKEFGVGVLVTKDSGKSGGLAEKIEACKECNITCAILGLEGE